MSMRKGERATNNIKGKSSLHAYHFMKGFEFEVKYIMMVYRISTGNNQVHDANKDRLAGLVNWYKVNRDMEDKIKLAATFYHLFMTSRPFIKDNQYMAHILMNTILLKHGYPPVVIPIEDKIEYLGRCSCDDESSISLIESIIRKRVGDIRREYSVFRNVNNING